MKAATLLSDEELQAGMKISPRAEQLESGGFLIVALLGVLVGFVVLLLGVERVALEIVYRLSPSLYEWLPPLVFLNKLLAWSGASFVCALVLFSSAAWISGTRRRACQAEWNRRYPLGIDVKDAKESLVSSGADWIAILSARFLPHGGMLWIRVDLKNGDAPFGPVRCRKFADGETILADLIVAEQQELRSLLRDLERALAAGDDVQGGPHFVHDGLPCDLQLLRRGEQPMLTYSLNMAGHRRGEPMAVVPALCGRMLEIAGFIADTRSIYGACDPFGKIEIGER